MLIWQDDRLDRPFGRDPRPDLLLEMFHETTKLHAYDMTGQAFRAAREGERPTSRYRNSLNFKFYPEHERVPLPLPRSPTVTLNEALKHRRSDRTFGGAPMTLADLADVLVPSLARARSRTEAGTSDNRMRFGPYPSGGAVYPVEHYLLLLRVAGLERSIAYFDPRNACLTILQREVPLERIEVAFTTVPGWLARCCFIVIQSVVSERSTVKYGPRGYRLALLEAGCAMQNILLACSAWRFAAVPWAGFLDDRLGALLGLELFDESVLAAAVVGRRSRR